MLIAGCSHAAGAEIDGTIDSAFNRQRSFGNQLAVKFGYKPVNIAINGACNSGIQRSVIEWYNENYSPDLNLFVLVCWTDSTRLETPFYRNVDIKQSNQSADWFSKSCEDYLRVNMFANGVVNEDERSVSLDVQNFIIRNEEMVEILNFQNVLSLQYYLQAYNIEYLMLNTNYVFAKRHRALNWYLEQVDRLRYVYYDDPGEVFYHRYREAGYTNPKATYYHLGEDAHTHYANFLEKYILLNDLLQKPETPQTIESVLKSRTKYEECRP